MMIRLGGSKSSNCLKLSLKLCSTLKVNKSLGLLLALSISECIVCAQNDILMETSINLISGQSLSIVRSICSSILGFICSRSVRKFFIRQIGAIDWLAMERKLTFVRFNSSKFGKCCAIASTDLRHMFAVVIFRYLSLCTFANILMSYSDTNTSLIKSKLIYLFKKLNIFSFQ